jgi:hypothetical protein
VKNPNSKERRRLKRRQISYYLPVLDNSTRKIIGHLIDISPIGLLMDSKTAIPANQAFTLRLDFMEEIAGKAFVEFNAQSKWCRPDSIQPYMYNVGFEIKDLASDGLEVIRRIAEKYGAG